MGWIFFLPNDESHEKDSTFDMITAAGILGYGSIWTVNEIIRLKRMRKIDGPLLSFTSTGVTDYFYLKRHIEWRDIEYVGCRSPHNQAENDYFLLKIAQPNRKYWIHRLYSYPLKYDLERLNIPGTDAAELYEDGNTVTSGSLNKKRIKAYLKEFAPKPIQNNTSRKISDYIPYIILSAFVVLSVFGQI